MDKNIISKNILVQKNNFQKAIGLMFKKKMEDFAMVFPFRKSRNISITMCCVFFPIDIIFLDERNVVVELKKNLKPFQNYLSKSHEVRIFIESPKGTIEKHKLELGSKLKVTKNSLVHLK